MRGIKFFLGTFILVALAHSSHAKSIKDTVTCLVIPSRQTVVQLAFDVTRLRKEVYMVAYDRIPSSGTTVLHIWNERTQDWQRISTEEYLAGTVFAKQPQNVILIGSDQDLPSDVTGVTTWCQDVFRIDRLDLVTLMNSLQQAYKFNEREWKWLANKYNIEYTDLNAERRRWGRYGKPGEEPTGHLPQNDGLQQETTAAGTMAPIEIITEMPAPEMEPALFLQPDPVAPVLTAPEDK